MGASDAGAGTAPLVIVVICIILFRYRRGVGQLVSRLWVRPLVDKHSSAAGTWTVFDERLLDATRLAAELRRGPPAAPDPPFALMRRERPLFSVDSCQISLLEMEQFTYPKWGTRLIQKSIAGYFVTPLINAIRNSRARAKAKRLSLKSAWWTEPTQGRVHLTNRRLVFDGDAFEHAILLRGVSKIRRQDEGVSFQVGVETKDTLPSQVFIYSPNDDWLYVALVYATRNKVPKLRLSDAFKARAKRAGHEVPSLES